MPDKEEIVAPENMEDWHPAEDPGPLDASQNLADLLDENGEIL